MRKYLLSILIVCICISAVMTCAPNVVHASGVNGENGAQEYSECFKDENGVDYYFTFRHCDNSNIVCLYQNNRIVQRAIADFSTGIIQYIQYNDLDERVLNNDVEYYNISDLIKDNVEVLQKQDDDISLTSFDTSGWALYGSYPKAGIYPNSRPCKLYYRNFDENPYDNKYSGKSISFGAGTAVSIIIAAVGVFLGGEITIATFVKAFGTVIVEGAIVDMITGEVCFSTQKVRYAPVINGKNIFTDAYITKRYTITYDKINVRMSYSINNASYKSNRGDSPSMIVLNAQVAEMGSR